MTGSHSTFFFKTKPNERIHEITFSVYVETARNTNAATVRITTDTTSFNRQWRIKVSFIECFSPSRAPIDCMQYFTGRSGIIMSYNFNGGHEMTANQEVTYCFRQEPGTTAIEYSVESDSSSPDYFNLNGDGTNNAMRTTSGTSCSNAVLSFVTEYNTELGGPSSTNYYCGNYLANVGGSTMSGVVRCK